MFGIDASIRRVLGDIGQWRQLYFDAQQKIAVIQQEVSDSRTEIVRHVADKDWFKLRLNQVEQERAQLIYAATGGYGQVPAVRTEGVKIAAPRFAEGPPLSETLNHQYNPFGTLGEDSIDPHEQIPGHTGEDFSHLPGYKS